MQDSHLDPFAIKLNPPIEKNREGTPLSKLRFGVKTLIAVKGFTRSFGNRIWDEKHRKIKSEKHSPCVKQLLQAGAALVGTLHSSEFAFGLNGESAYGIPLNPSVHNALPGGSSSGSASAVASGVLHFALGTDTGGSIRVPAAYCGVMSLRPTQGVISTENVLAVSTEYDTIGIIASNGDLLMRVVKVLIPRDNPPALELRKIYVVRDAFNLCAPEIKVIYKEKIAQLSQDFIVQEIAMHEILNEEDPQFHGMNGWKSASMLMLLNTWETLGPWLEKNIPNWESNNSSLTEETRTNFIAAKQIFGLVMQNSEIKLTAQKRVNRYKVALETYLTDDAALLIPTIQRAAPTITENLSQDEFMNMISLTAISSLAGIPQVQIPAAQDQNARPLGLSLLGKSHQDHVLLQAAVRVERILKQEAKEMGLH